MCIRFGQLFLQKREFFLDHFDRFGGVDESDARGFAFVGFGRDRVFDVLLFVGHARQCGVGVGKAGGFAVQIFPDMRDAHFGRFTRAGDAGEFFVQLVARDDEVLQARGGFGLRAAQGGHGAGRIGLDGRGVRRDSGQIRHPALGLRQ